MTHTILAAWIVGGFIICNNSRIKWIGMLFGLAIIFFATLLGQA